MLSFRFTDEQVVAPGGNESQIPKVFSEVLRPLGWRERKFTTKLLVNDKPVSSDTHKVDYVEEQVAFDLEWNSKDQTFDATFSPSARSTTTGRLPQPFS